MGNFGVSGSFSFQTTKVLTTGEGGMVVTNDEELFEKMKSVRIFGVDQSNPLLHDGTGSNFKMSEFVGLLGICELDRVERRMKLRQNLAERYQQNLKGTAWKALSPGDLGKTGYYKQIVMSPIPRSEVSERLSRQNIALTGGV